MNVRRFLAWCQAAPEEPRAGSAAAMARALVSPDSDPQTRADAEAAITLLLDDPAPLVRRAIAETLCGSPLAPGHVIAALAGEPGETGALVLARSPLLAEGDLIERAATGDAAGQAAIASRSDITAPVAAALAEVAEADAIVALLSNPGAPCPDFALERIVERFGHDLRIQDALFARPGLPVSIRHMAHVAAARATFACVQAQAAHRVAQAERDTAERAALFLAGLGEAEREEMVAYLRRSGQLTAGLLLRAAAGGDVAFLAAALSSLAGMPVRRVAALLSEGRAAALAALGNRAGLGDASVIAMRAALAAHRRLARARQAAQGPSRLAEACRRTVAACVDAGLDSHEVTALFRRLEAEHAREAAREAGEKMLELNRIETEAPLLLGAPDDVLLLPAPAQRTPVPHDALHDAAQDAAAPVPSGPDRHVAFAQIIEDAVAALVASDQENATAEDARAEVRAA